MTDSLHVLFSDEGHPVAIRKWSKEPFDDAVEYVRKSDCADLIAACDAALDWADANARAFPIETAPKDQKILLWNDLFNTWVGAWWSEGDEYPKLTSMLVMDVKHSKFWRPEPPPPSNPPLPAPLEQLGEVLRKVKGVE